MTGALKEYHVETRKPAYTAVLVIPFLAVYEIGLVYLRLRHGDFEVRNGGDAIVRGLLFPFGAADNFAFLHVFVWPFFSALVLLAVFAAWVYYDGRKLQLQSGFVVAAAGESFFAAIFLLLVPGLLSGIEFSVPGLDIGSPAAGIVLSCGAGVYEEFVFRFMLVGGLAWIATRIVGLERVRAGLVAVTLSALLFSLIHFGGAYGDSWNAPDFWWRFAFRSFAGLYFSALYYFRSFGIAVAAHAQYDILIVLLQAAAAEGEA